MTRALSSPSQYSDFTLRVFGHSRSCPPASQSGHTGVPLTGTPIHMHKPKKDPKGPMLHHGIRQSDPVVRKVLQLQVDGTLQPHHAFSADTLKSHHVELRSQRRGTTRLIGPGCQHCFSCVEHVVGLHVLQALLLELLGVDRCLKREKERTLSASVSCVHSECSTSKLGPAFGPCAWALALRSGRRSPSI